MSRRFESDPSHARHYYKPKLETKLNKKIVVAGIAIITALSLGACGVGKATEPFKDAKTSGVINDTAADNITMPDGFSNVTTKCDHGNRIYVAYHGDKAYASIAVIPQDPTCKG